MIPKIKFATMVGKGSGGLDRGDVGIVIDGVRLSSFSEVVVPIKLSLYGV